MNYCGSYRRLLRNSRAALLASIEIYNKPQMAYRNECSVILFVNAWELLLKSILSKNRQSIYYPKRRGQPYRTLSWQDAFPKAARYFPDGLQALALQRSLELLGSYRDNCIHFYNVDGFGAVIHALVQTSVINYRDLAAAVFGVDIVEDITWEVLPLGTRPQIDPVQYIAGHTGPQAERANAVSQFVNALARSTKELEDQGLETGRLLTVFSVKLEAVKKIRSADVVVGLGTQTDSDGPLAMVRSVDPNVSHPFRQKDVLAEIDSLAGHSFTSYTCQAITWKYRVKENQALCWVSNNGDLTRYSRDLVPWLRRLTPHEVAIAITEYKEHMRQARGAEVPRRDAQ